MSKRILFVINTLGMAGAEMALLELLDRFDSPEYRVDLYVLMGQGELASRLPGHVRLLNKRYSLESVLSARGRRVMVGRVFQAMLRRGTVFRRFPYLVGNSLDMIKRGRFQVDKLLWRILSDGGERSEEEYDLAIAFIEGGAAYYVHDHVRAKKIAVFFHIDYRLSGYTRKLDRDCYADFDKIFPVSEETMKSFLEIYPECKEHTHVFHNMINQEKILEKSELAGGFTDSFEGVRILTVARLNKQKAYPIAIEAMEKLKKAGIKARWYVLGEGEERSNLEKLIEAKGLQEDFLLLGTTENPYPYFRQTDLYVHATAYEGKSIAIQEAQTLSCSIIVSDILSNRQQVEDGVDGLVCRLEPGALADAIRDLIQHPEKARMLGENAGRRRISFEEDMRELIDLL